MFTRRRRGTRRRSERGRGARSSRARMCTFSASAFAIEAVSPGRALDRGDRGGLRDLQVPAKNPSRKERRRNSERCTSSGRARETVSRDAPGYRRGRNRPGTWSRPCRDRGRCPAGRRRCPRPCPSSGTSGPSRRCPCRAGRGWRRAGGARRGRQRRPDTTEREGSGKASVSRAHADRAKRARRSREAPRRRAGVETRGIIFSRQRVEAESGAVAFACDRARAIAPGAYLGDGHGDGAHGNSGHDVVVL